MRTLPAFLLLAGGLLGGCQSLHRAARVADRLEQASSLRLRTEAEAREFLAILEPLLAASDEEIRSGLALYERRVEERSLDPITAACEVDALLAMMFERPRNFRSPLSPQVAYLSTGFQDESSGPFSIPVDVNPDGSFRLTGVFGAYAGPPPKSRPTLVRLFDAERAREPRRQVHALGRATEPPSSSIGATSTADHGSH
jgi:hypothetical protein